MFVFNYWVTALNCQTDPPARGFNIDRHRACSYSCAVTVPAGGEIDGLGFDEVIARLRAVVERLEQGNLGLEDSLRAYEEGVGLARRGHQLLDGAEKRVELLVKARPGAAAVVTPLDPDAEGGERDDG